MAGKHKNDQQRKTQDWSNYTDAELIKDTRVKLGITQLELAARSGVSEITISNLENQKSRGRKQTWLKLFDALIKELKKRRNNQ